MRLGLLAVGVLLTGCERISSLDCAEIADRAKQISAHQPLPVSSFANVQETRRSDSEVRCSGTATFADGGTAPLHFRARVEDGKIEVAYQGIPFE